MLAKETSSSRCCSGSILCNSGSTRRPPREAGNKVRPGGKGSTIFPNDRLSVPLTEASQRSVRLDWLCISQDSATLCLGFLVSTLNVMWYTMNILSYVTECNKGGVLQPKPDQACFWTQPPQGARVIQGTWRTSPPPCEKSCRTYRSGMTGAFIHLSIP